MSVRDNLGRFARNKNKWVVEGDIAECYLGGELLFFTNAYLYDSLCLFSFSKLADGYSAARVGGKEIPVHRIISNPAPTDIVDHINRNKKDNRIENLRNTDKSINAFNSKIRSTNTSGVTGVWYRKDTNRWVAEIKKNYTKVSLGCFETKEEAIAARKRAEVKIYGD